MRNDSSESFFHPTFSFDLGRAYSLSPCPRVPRRQECRLRVILDEAPGRLGFVQGASANRRDPPDPAVRQSRRGSLGSARTQRAFRASALQTWCEVVAAASPTFQEICHALYLAT